MDVSVPYPSYKSARLPPTLRKRRASPKGLSSSKHRYLIHGHHHHSNSSEWVSQFYFAGYHFSPAFSYSFISVVKKDIAKNDHQDTNMIRIQLTIHLEIIGMKVLMKNMNYFEGNVQYLLLKSRFKCFDKKNEFSGAQRWKKPSLFWLVFWLKFLFYNCTNIRYILAYDILHSILMLIVTYCFWYTLDHRHSISLYCSFRIISILVQWKFWNSLFI